MSIHSHENKETMLPPKRELSCESNMLEDAKRQKTEQDIKSEELIETQECKIPDKSLVNVNYNLTKNLIQIDDIDLLRENEEHQSPTTSVACSKNDSPIEPIKLFDFNTESVISITLRLVKKVILVRGPATIYKNLFTDGKEYLEISEWRLDQFSNYAENQILNFENYLLKKVLAENAYFIKMNTKNFTLMRTDKSNLTLSNLNIQLPNQNTILEIKELASNYYEKFKLNSHKFILN